jgi:hypothetical protein
MIMVVKPPDKPVRMVAALHSSEQTSKVRREPKRSLTQPPMI